jgi:prepilin-type N-terminal cleavage/methylation domain-containing protein
VSPPDPEAGFSLIELLVTLFIASVMMTLMTGFFRATVNVRHDMGIQTETQQGLRAVFEMVTQELRQAGACLPQNGQFIALDGEDGGTQDSLTLRIGRTDPTTLRCIKAGTTAAVSDSNTLPMVAGDGDLFKSADQVYVTPDGATGDFYRVTATTSTSVTLDRTGTFPVGTGVYAIDERIYQVETLDSRPVLTVSIDGSDSYPIVDGVKKFNVQYWLESNTNPGTLDPTPENLPGNATDWRRVRMLTITATVEAKKKSQDGTVAQEDGHIDVKPRNLL